MSLLRVVKAHQAAFRGRLLLLRQRQLEAARQRKLQEGYAWRAYLDGLRAYRRSLVQGRCQYCERVAGRCVCDLKAPYALLAAGLRRLAGLHLSPGGRHKRGRRGEWVDWNAGKDGPRNCGPECWDAAVRAYEE